MDDSVSVERSMNECVNLLLYWMYAIQINAPQPCAWQNKKSWMHSSDTVQLWVCHLANTQDICCLKERQMKDETKAGNRWKKERQTLLIGIDCRRQAWLNGSFWMWGVWLLFYYSAVIWNCYGSPLFSHLKINWFIWVIKTEGEAVSSVKLSLERGWWLITLVTEVV